MENANNSILHLLAMYYSPLALPHKSARTNATWLERRRIHRINMLKIRPFLRRYIFRSGQLTLAMFVASYLFATIVPIPMLAVFASIGIIIAVLHTVFLIFMQQTANDIAAKIGIKNDEIENIEEIEDNDHDRPGKL